MKPCIFAAVCLAVVVCATSNDINVGERKPGDVLVASRRLFRVSTIEINLSLSYNLKLTFCFFMYFLFLFLN